MSELKDQNQTKLEDTAKLPNMSFTQSSKQEPKKKTGAMKWIIAVLLVLCIGVGWVGGSLLPMSFLESMRSKLRGAFGLSSSNKIDSVLEVMENDWFFGDGVENLDQRLVDQALIGITTNNEDPHTEYMSSDELSSFTQSINRNVVGIGVTYHIDNGLIIIDEVYNDSPAHEIGVQAGDIIYAVNGESTEGWTGDDLKEHVQGEEGTKVQITFLRGANYITYDITRKEVSTTAIGKKLEDGTPYLRLIQFGDTSFEEVKGYLEEIANDQTDSLIIDLRNNGGGYLTSLAKLASLFLPKDTNVITQVYADGSETEIHTTADNQLENIHNIVILVNQKTASAAEAFTLAMKEKRDDVTVIGTTTYGKGTVQVTRQFSDGSALKYTTSKWVSPNGTWINETGITPDIEVKLHDVMYQSFGKMEEGSSYTVDQVSDVIQSSQLCLDYLGYSVDRTDGYFSTTTQDALMQFQKDQTIEETGRLDETTYRSLISAVTLDWNTTKNHDTQLAKALEVLHG